MGNEIKTDFCGETEWRKIIEILNACADAVKQILPDVLIVAHFTNPEREWGINYFADILNENNYNYDILSTSYYPFWHCDLTNLKNKFNYIEETYNKKF